jgi:hypothetical protein
MAVKLTVKVQYYFYTPNVNMYFRICLGVDQLELSDWPFFLLYGMSCPKRTRSYGWLEDRDIDSSFSRVLAAHQWACISRGLHSQA